MLLQLNPPIPLLTPRGKGMAHLVSDLGPEHHLEWTCLLDGGEVWTFRNPEVRALENITAGRQPASPEPVKPLERAAIPNAARGDDHQAIPTLVSESTIYPVRHGNAINGEPVVLVTVIADIPTLALTETFLQRALSFARGHGFADAGPATDWWSLRTRLRFAYEALEVSSRLLRDAMADPPLMRTSTFLAQAKDLASSVGYRGMMVELQGESDATGHVEPHSNS